MNRSCRLYGNATAGDDEARGGAGGDAAYLLTPAPRAQVPLSTPPWPPTSKPNEEDSPAMYLFWATKAPPDSGCRPAAAARPRRLVGMDMLQ